MKNFGRLITTLAFAMAAVAVPSVMAQTDTGTVTGHVTDPSASMLQGAEIQLQPGGRTVVSDQTGGYFINGLSAGNYTITVSYLGFAMFQQNVDVTSGKVTIFDVKMQVASQKDQIIVTADAASGEAEAVNREKTADNVLQVMTSEVITSLPNANIADAVGRLPGVSLERDEGEGKYIQVRSLEPRLTNATIDGVNVPSPEPGVREIKFDAMPADLVESVEVNKTLQANMDGDGIGGSVNIVTKTAGEKPTVDLVGSGGASPLLGGQNLYLVGGTVGERFGHDKRWGALVGATYDYNSRGINDIEPVPDVGTYPNGSSTRWFDQQDMRDYEYNRSRWGVTGSIDYKLGEGSDIYLRGIYSSFEDFGNKWVYTLYDNTPNVSVLNANGCSVSGGVETCGAGVPHYSQSNRVPIFNIGSIVLGGKHVLSTSWIAWDVSVSRSTQIHSGGDEGVDFQPNATYNNLYPNGSSCQFSPATAKQYIPGWTPNCYTEAYAATNYDLEDINTSFGQSPQLNLQGAGAYGKRYHIGSHLSTIEIGGKFRNEHKFDNSYTPTYTPNGSLPMTMFLGNFTNSNYYLGQYPKFAPTTSWSKLINYLNANPSQFTLTTGGPGPQPQNFDYVEQISAGYVMDTIDFSKFRVVAGVRVEGTNLTTYTPSFDSNNNYLGNTVMYGNYINVLPSASVRYDMGHDTDIRVVYSRALSRPDPQDIAQALTVTLNQSPMVASFGNPNLKAETANNYDVLIEHYLKPFGMIEGGFFYKQLYNPIVSQTELKEAYTPVPNDPTRYPVGAWYVSQPINAGTGWLAGFELSYVQQFTTLPGIWGGLGLGANYTWSNSAACGLPGRSDCPALLRQAPNIFNISPTYDRGRLSLRMGMTYNQASIYQYQYQDGTGGSTPSAGGLYGPNGDNYLYTHFQVDVQGSYRLNWGFTVMAYGMNLTNEVFGFYNGQKQYLTQREYYGPTFAMGLRWSPTHEK